MVTNNLVAQTENVFSIATAISPIVLLNPKQYSKMVVGRKHLVSVSHPSFYVDLLYILLCLSF